jgi:tRNA threonylcarbamoyladenosine biosynthesis protein TsaB
VKCRLTAGGGSIAGVHGSQVILAIETSQRAGGVAMDDGRGAVRAARLDSGAGQDEELMPAIAKLFEEAQMPPEALGCVGVSIGPGGFTGLRIAVATAKMLAMTLGARIVAVPSALAAVEGSARFPGEDAQPLAGEGPVLVALAAKRNTFWGTLLRRSNDIWTIAEPGRLIESEGVPLEGVKAVLGDRYLPKGVRARCDAAGVLVLEPVFDARACLEVTRRKAASAEFADPRELVPLYARPPEAVSLWRQRGGR